MKKRALYLVLCVALLAGGLAGGYFGGPVLDTALADRRLAAEMEGDPRYGVVNRVEAECLHVWVVNVEIENMASPENMMVIVWLWMDEITETAESADIVTMMRQAEVVAAKAVLENFGRVRLLGVMWVDFFEVPTVRGVQKGVQALYGYVGPFQIILEWATDDGSKEGFQALLKGGITVYIPWLYGPAYTTALPRSSTDAPPWLADETGSCGCGE